MLSSFPHQHQSLLTASNVYVQVSATTYDPGDLPYLVEEIQFNGTIQVKASQLQEIRS